MMASLFASAIGIYLYIGCEMGALIIGWILGGFVGIGTLITVFGIGYCVQITFKIFRFDINALRHRNLKQGLIFMNECINN